MKNPVPSVYYNTGNRFLPVRTSDKVNLVKGEIEKVATRDIKKLVAWKKQFPDCGWKMTCENSVVLDADRHPDKPDGVLAYKGLAVSNSFPETHEIKTPRGLRAIYSKHTGTVCDYRSKLADSLEVMTGRSQTVVVAGDGYEISNDSPIVPPNDSLLRLVVDAESKSSDSHFDVEYSPEDEIAHAQEVLDRLSTRRRDDRNDWERVSAALSTLQDQEKAFVLFDRWSMNGPTYKGELDCRKTFFSHRRKKSDKTLNFGSLVMWAKEDDPNWNPSWMVTPIEYSSSKMDNGSRRVLHHLHEAFEDRPAVPYVIDELFQECTVSVVAGDGGTGKTSLMLNAMLNVARGTEFIGKSTVQSPTLFINEELADDLFASRVKQVALGCDAVETDQVHWTSMAGFDFLHNADDVLLLERFILETGSKLIVIDALSDVMPSGDENTSKDMTNLFLSLRKVASDTHSAIVMIHHVNKNGGFRGSSDIKNKADNMYIVTMNDGGEVALKPEKVRNGSPKTLHVQMDFSIEKIVITVPERPSKSFGNLSESEDEVYGLFLRHKSLTIKDVQAKVNEQSTVTARKNVFELAKKGYIRRPRGDGGQGSKATYVLADDEEDRKIGNKKNPQEEKKHAKRRKDY